jgi:hypothetical protein
VFEQGRDKPSRDRHMLSEQFALMISTASSGAAATSRRTLTVVIKFDKASLVTDFTYHANRF